MATIEHEPGVWLDYDDAAFRVDTLPRPSAHRRRGGAFDEAPVLIAPDAAAGDSAAQRLADRLVARGIASRASRALPIGPGPGAPAPERRVIEMPRQPTRLRVELGDGEDAVVLVEGDGVLAWRYGTAEPAGSALSGTSRHRRRSATPRMLVFDLGLPPIANIAVAPAGAADRRGWLLDRLVEGVKAIVLYFAAETVADAAVQLLERRRRDGPVIVTSATDPGQWLRPDHFRELDLPRDRPARVLMLVHGTFSSTLGGFGELCVTPWGQRLLTASLARYDAVIAFDHRTLAKSPLDNARDLLAALQTLPTSLPIEIDAVCHSRGGLVLRTLTERLLPGAGLALHVRRAVFVAATNRGTELARPENWESMVDLVTNLTATTAKVLSLFPPAATAAKVADEAVDALGDFVRYLVRVAVTQRRVPGIAAMDPGSDFVRDLNLTQPGQPGPSDIDCYAVVSDFYAKLSDDGGHEPKEMPRRLALLLADGVVDRLMRGDGAQSIPNDLVVDVASMTDIDRAVGGFVKDVLDFGRNPLVYHTNYFLRPETVGRIAQWLRLPSPVGDVDPLRLAGAERGIARIDARASLAEAQALIATERPRFLVLDRPDPSGAPRRLRYAVTPDELMSFTRGADPSAAIVDAFNLHESEQSGAFDGQAMPFDSAMAGLEHGHRPHARRGVVVEGDRPTAVLAEGFGAADAAALAALAHAMSAAVPSGGRAGDAQAPGGTRRTRDDRGDDEGDSDSTRSYEFGADEDYNADDGESPRRGGGRGRRGASRATSIPPSPSTPERAAPPAPATARAETFATAEMAREVACARETLVTVTLSAEPIEVSAGVVSASGAFPVDSGQKLVVHVIPRRGFDYAPSDPTQGRAEVDPPRAGVPVVLDFGLLANEVGPGEVTVAIRQGAQRLLTLTVRSMVVDPTARPERGSSASSGGLTPGADCGLCPTLQIFDRRNAGQLQYEYILRAGNVDDRFRSAPIAVDPKAYVEARYGEIESAWLGSQRAIDRFAQRLEAIGGVMFRQLFPLPLQQALWRLFEAGALDDILVYSDEPFLPWEVVFLDDPGRAAASGRGRFFGELGLCRWLYGAPPVCSITVGARGARYVIPAYPDPQLRLPGAEGPERQMLESELGATAVPPRHDTIVDLLRQPGAFDLLHFACHGKAEAQDIDAAALLLEGELFQTPRGQTWGKESLLASTVDQVANLMRADGNRPLVVVNACQTGRLGYALTGLGGFATAFLGTREGTGSSRGKAGAFVGALWSVGDQAASRFVASMYAGLKAGRTMAEATQQARTDARTAGEGTWLAYAVYAHPHLRVTFA